MEKLELLRFEMPKKPQRKKNVRDKRFRPPAPRYDDVFFEGVAQLDRIPVNPSHLKSV